MDASDPKQVREQLKKSKIADRLRKDVIRNLMSTIAGRRFVYELLDGCHCFASSFALNALQMAHNEGERNVGLKLLTDIMAICPDYYVLMMREYNERAISNDRDSSSGDSGPGGEYSGSEDSRGRVEGNARGDPEAADPHGYYTRES